MLARLVTALTGRYEIERELGRGGMATVYLAHDVRHGRHVAIKVLDPELGSSVGPERFLREIATAARLTHPNILPLHDSGEAAGLLYYVMPYVRGESLRRRLDRERQLPIDDAVAIAREVASALDYAHMQGVVHRDIKPENILMGEGGHAIVADFGLARALHDAAADAPLTGTGLAVGTPAYMSPEQASAERTVDARTDIYSLGCVVFEMIAGMPPFRGATVQAIVAHHLATPAPSLCIDRASCPEAIDTAVQRALAKTPADRFRSAGEFVRAMDPDAIGAGTAGSSGSSGRRRTPALSGAAPGSRARARSLAVVGIVTAAAIGLAAYAALGRTDSPPNSSHLAVLPFSIGTSDSITQASAAAFQRRLRDAFGEWEGLRLVTQVEIARELTSGSDAERPDRAIEIARRLGAGRVIRGTVQRIGDSIEVTATRYVLGDGKDARTRVLTYAFATPPSKEELRPFANAMIRDRDELPLPAPDSTRKPHLEAWVAYDAGRIALDSWNLAEAEGRFREAVRLDPSHAQAQLWLAQTLTWADDPDARGDLRQAARRATELRSQLAPRDADIADGLLASAERRHADACIAFRRVIGAEFRDFAGWYGLGECQTRDSIIVESRRSPSGFAFRGSFHSGARAYVQALESVAGAAPDFVYVRLGSVLRTQMNQQRSGFRVVGTDTVHFGAYPGLVADTLAYVPYPAATLVGAMPDHEPRAHARALERNRAQLRDLFLQWVRTSKGNPRAHETLARLLETTGDIAPAAPGQVSALTSTRTARSLAVDSLRRLELASDEVRLLLKNEQFADAADLADSLLAAHPAPTPREADHLLGLAALTGRLERMTDLLRGLTSGQHAPAWPDGRPMDLPPVLTQRLAGARSAAMLGTCTDSAIGLGAWVDQSLGSYYVDAGERQRVRDALVWRPLSQAVPCLGVSAVKDVQASDRLLRLQQALHSGGAAAFRAGFDSLQVARKDLRPGDVAIDYTFHEAWLLAAAGDTTRAILHLDRSLDALSTLGTFLESQPSQAAGLVRAMMLRARLAAARGDRQRAMKWAGAAATLWAKGSASIRAEIAEMQGLASQR